MQYDHTFVGVKDRSVAQKFISNIFDVKIGIVDSMQAVFITKDVKFIYTDKKDSAFLGRRYFAFLVSEEEFQEIVYRLKNQKICYGSDVKNLDGQIKLYNEGKMLYFLCPDKHIWKIQTKYDSLTF